MQIIGINYFDMEINMNKNKFKKCTIVIQNIIYRNKLTLTDQLSMTHIKF